MRSDDERISTASTLERDEIARTLQAAQRVKSGAAYRVEIFRYGRRIVVQEIKPVGDDG